MDEDVRFFTLSAPGLETVTLDEVREIPGGVPERACYRVVEGRFGARWLAGLLRLRTADDAYVLLGRRTGIPRVRAALTDLGNWAAGLQVGRAVDLVAAVRPLPTRPSFAVSASFVGRRNHTGAEIEAAVAAAVRRRDGWPWEAEDGLADLLVRVFLVHDRCWMGLRLARRPLHRRTYKERHIPGSLRPPVAAAMCRLAGVGAGTRVLDPCCGAGTILAEAAALGAPVMGGDLDPAAVSAAAANLRWSQRAPLLARWDACRLPLARGSADLAVCNPPWGVQVAAGGGAVALVRELMGQLAVALPEGARAALLVEAQEHIDQPGWVVERRLSVSLAGRRPTIVVARRGSGC